jgi:hypothetical protein
VDHSSTNDQTPAPSDDASDFVWGADNIGREIDRTPSQVYHLVQIGALDGAVAKLGHRTLVGSRKRLRNLVTNKLKVASAA